MSSSAAATTESTYVSRLPELRNDECYKLIATMFFSSQNPYTTNTWMFRPNADENAIVKKVKKVITEPNSDEGKTFTNGFISLLQNQSIGVKLSMSFPHLRSWWVMIHAMTIMRLSGYDPEEKQVFFFETLDICCSLSLIHFLRNLPRTSQQQYLLDVLNVIIPHTQKEKTSSNWTNWVIPRLYKNCLPRFSAILVSLQHLPLIRSMPQVHVKITSMIRSFDDVPVLPQVPVTKPKMNPKIQALVAMFWGNASGGNPSVPGVTYMEAYKRESYARIQTEFETFLANAGTGVPLPVPSSSSASSSVPVVPVVEEEEEEVDPRPVVPVDDAGQEFPEPDIDGVAGGEPEPEPEPPVEEEDEVPVPMDPNQVEFEAHIASMSMDSLTFDLDDPRVRETIVDFMMGGIDEDEEDAFGPIPMSELLPANQEEDE